LRHDVEDPQDELLGHLVVEQVAHEADEDAAGLGPVQRRVEKILVGGHLEALGVAQLADSL